MHRIRHDGNRSIDVSTDQHPQVGVAAIAHLLKLPFAGFIVAEYQGTGRERSGRRDAADVGLGQHFAAKHFAGNPAEHEIAAADDRG